MKYFRASVVTYSSTAFNNNNIIISCCWHEPALQFRLYLNKSHAGEKPGEGSVLCAKLSMSYANHTRGQCYLPRIV